MDKTINVVRIDEAAELDFDYWLTKSPTEKLDTLQLLREMVYDLKHENRKGLRRFLRITRRKKS